MLTATDPTLLDWLMLLFKQGGNGITAVLLAGFFYLMDQRILAYIMIFGTLTLWLAVELINTIIQRARPFEKLVDVRVVG